MFITIPIRLPSAGRIDNIVFAGVSVSKTIVVHVFIYVRAHLMSIAILIQRPVRTPSDRQTSELERPLYKINQTFKLYSQRVLHSRRIMPRVCPSKHAMVIAFWGLYQEFNTQSKLVKTLTLLPGVWSRAASQQDMFAPPPI